MVTVVGVRFREVGKIYYFAPGELILKRGDHVIVDTVRGQEYGTVMLGNRQVEDEDIVKPLKAVDRIATQDDEEREAANRDKEQDAFKICKARIREHGLDMKLISAEYAFDNSKILFCFTADGRVDFRDLVKDLASIFKIRIELRQVGVRDETKIMGGIGYCGRPLCCCSYLSDFVPVSIKMAKEQNLSLNPQKISGMCGRLMCCLKNEVEAYEDLNTRLPKQGAKVRTKDGREGIAQNVNVLRESIQVLFTDDKGNREMEEFAASELKFTPRRKKPACAGCEGCRGAQENADAQTSGESDVTGELSAETEEDRDPELLNPEAEGLPDAEKKDIESAHTDRPRRRRKPYTERSPKNQDESGRGGNGSSHRSGQHGTDGGRNRRTGRHTNEEVRDNGTDRSTDRRAETRQDNRRKNSFPTRNQRRRPRINQAGDAAGAMPDTGHTDRHE